MNSSAKELLLDVLNNMSQGVLMFDSETRLLFCNHRYIEMYGLSPEAAKPGCTLRDLLNRRMKAGTFSGNPEDTQSGCCKASREGEPRAIFSS